MKATIGCFIGLVFGISLSAEPLLEGRVRLASGEPVADAQVRLFDLTDLWRGPVARAMTDGTGYFALPLAVLAGSVLPESFTLGQNYPNPFNPSTIIPYQLAASAEVRLDVFNLLGQHIATLVNGERPAGFHTATWHAEDGVGRAVGAGVYIYRLTVGMASQTGRMVLIDGQAGLAAGGMASVLSGASGGGGSNREGAQVYRLTVSGSGLVPYMDPAFRVEAGMSPVELVVPAAFHPASKATADTSPLCDYLGSDEEDQGGHTAPEADDTPEGEEADAPVAIPDANLRAVIESHLGKASAAPIYRREMATLRSLDASYTYKRRVIRDLEGIQFAANLEELQLTENAILDASPLDLSPLAGLTNLRRLNLQGINDVKDPLPLDLSPLAGLTNLTWLNLRRNNILDLSPLAGLTNLLYLHGQENKIADVSPLAGLSELREVFLTINNISDLSPLAANTGLGSGDVVDVKINPLNAASISAHIPSLQARGVSVAFDEVIVFTGPQIYNDNVFVLPIAENLAAGDLQLKNYAARFYEYFSDEFDFLMFVPNLAPSQHERVDTRKSTYHHVMNDVQGIGLWTFFADDWGSAGKLQGVINFGGNSIYPISDRGRSILSAGPTLHELMHRWANYIVPLFYRNHWGHRSHWGFSSANGTIGGFDITNLVDHGGGRYTAGNFFTGGFADNVTPYSPIELYLAGFIPPEEVPELWVAEDGEFLRDEEGQILRDDNGDRIFTASRVTTYAIEDIIAKHKPRIPDASQAQKDFRAAAILLIDENHPSTREILETVSRDVSWFSHAGYDRFDGIDDPGERYNFYEATGGRGTITMDGLSQLQSRARAKKLVPISFGIPPQPIVDHWE